MPDYLTPGVYVEEIPHLPPSVTAVETAVPAFIGYTAKATLHQPGDLLKKAFRIQSLTEYEQYFGNPAPETESLSVLFSGAAAVGRVDETKRSKFLMHYSLQQFFANGGGPCWIIAVGDYTSAGNTVSAQALLEGLAVAEEQNGITLLLLPDAVNIETPEAYYGVCRAAINQSARLQDRFTLLDVYHAAVNGNHWQQDIALLRSSLDGQATALKYAAAYFPRIFTPVHFDYTINGAPDQSLISIEGLPAGVTTLAALQQSNQAQYTAAKKAVEAIPLLLPVSPAIAGIYAMIDNTRGVWKAPANVSLNNTLQPAIAVSSNEQEGLNISIDGKSINTVRTFAGKGTLVWGARTLDGNSNDWRYIQVKRYCIMVEQSVQLAVKAFVFEPNNQKTWVAIKTMVENFLVQQWRAGALSGASPQDAFFVQVGLGTTMTEQDIFEGRLVVALGLAITRPAEFVQIRFMQKMLAES